MAQRARRRGLLTFVIPAILGLIPLQAATVSRENADVFARKLSEILGQGGVSEGIRPRRTPVTEDEVNSWFMYTAQPLLPAGILQPQITLAGQGRLTGQAIVDLDAVARGRSTGGRLDPWSFVGGRVPVSVTGLLHTRDGVGRFEVESAEISGVPIPTMLLQELLGQYSDTPGFPQGLTLDDAFQLPASIRQIEVGQGQAVVVQ